MRNISNNYKINLLKKLEANIVSPPKKLRCGIARGKVYSVGNGNDFVGPCINMAARLQKLGSFSFCCSRRGLNPELNPFLNPDIIKIKSKIIGVGSDEIICVLKSEYDALLEEEKKNFK